MFCCILRDLLTADPDEITPAPAEDERQRTRSGATSAPRERSGDPHRRQTERRSTHERRRQRPETAPAPLASQPRRRSQPSQHRRAPRRDGTRHPAPLFTQPTAPDITPEAPHPPTVSALFAVDILSHARAPRRFTAHTSAAPRALTFRKCAKNEMNRRPHNRPIYSTFQALDGNGNGNTADRQISLMRRINRRSTEPQRSGATFTFALNPGRAVALLGRPQINSFWNYLPRTPLTPKHVQPP